MPQQIGAHCSIREGLLPIQAHPGGDEIPIQRTLAAEHQIDACCLVEEIGALLSTTHLAFEPDDQAWKQNIAQSVAIDRPARRPEFIGLRQPQIHSGSSLCAEWQVTRLIENRQDRGQITILHRIERMLRDHRRIAVQGDREPIDIRLVRLSRVPHRCRHRPER